MTVGAAERVSSEKGSVSAGEGEPSQIGDGAEKTHH